MCFSLRSTFWPELYIHQTGHRRRKCPGPARMAVSHCHALYAHLFVFHIVSIDLKKKNIKPLLIIAFFSPLTYFIGEAIGISKTTASESGVFLACIPISALLASTFILHKKPTARQITGILTTFLGILVTVFAVGMSTSLSAVGYVFLSIAVTSYAFYSIFVERASAFTGAEITYVMLILNLSKGAVKNTNSERYPL